MVCSYRSVCLACGSSVTPATAASGRFAASFFQSISKHGLGMLDGPSVGEHLIESWIVVVQTQQQFAQVRPRFDAVTLGASEDREQDSRPRAGLSAAQEQPVFSADR